MPSQARAVVPGLPPLTDEALDQAMHLVEPGGKVSRGGYAVGPLLRYLPGGWLIRWLFWLPGVSAVSHALYRQVARRRHRWGCGGDGCAFPGAASR